MTERDSAGIRIVESRTPAWTGRGAWQASELPLLQIGSVDGEPSSQLFQVRSVRQTRSGNIVVVNAGSSQVRVYSSSGILIRAIGREGSGPGEFRYPRNLWISPGDSLIVADLDRISVFDSAGNYARGFAFGTGAPRDRFDDGMYLRLVFAAGVNPIELGQTRPQYALVRWSPDGGVNDTIAELPGSDSYRYSPDGNGIFNYASPFGRQLLLAVHRGSIYTGDGGTWAVSQLDEQGRVVRIMRRASSQVPVTGGDIQAFEQMMVESARTDQQRSQLQQLFLSWKYPAVRPFYDRLIVDLQGNIWTRKFQIGSSETSDWTVFDEAGRWLGEVVLPGSLMVNEIGDDYVLGVWQDDLGVEYVQRYALMK